MRKITDPEKDPFESESLKIGINTEMIRQHRGVVVVSSQPLTAGSCKSMDQHRTEHAPMHARAQRTDRRGSILPQHVFRSYSTCSDPTHASRCDRSPITDHRNADHVASLN
jgi:hypothetical protein